MGRAASLAEQAFHRKLAVLPDGPWAPAWYSRDDLEALQGPQPADGYPDGHPTAAPALPAQRPVGGPPHRGRRPRRRLDLPTTPQER